MLNVDQQLATSVCDSYLPFLLTGFDPVDNQCVISEKFLASLFICGLLITNWCQTFAQSSPAESQLARSDAVAGSTLGWYVGRQVYQRRHNAELGGASLAGSEYDANETQPRPPEKMGSPYVALDSWVYPAFERLAATGYVQTAFLGLRPWTRMECAQLLDRARENYADEGSDESVLLDLASALQQEFRYELELLEGRSGHNRTLQLESAYARVVSISGTPLTDSFHFGQTLAHDFGRPFREGGNVQVGASFRAALGPAALYVRGEFQHAPAAPALSDPVRAFIATADLVNTPPAAAFAPINRPRLLDTYVALNLRRGWQLSFGKQSLFWAPGPAESFLWSNNIEPVPMLRLTQSEMYLPGFLRLLGPARVDSFFGRLDGHTHVPRPFIYGNKINFKLLPNLELGFGRTVQIGGRGGDPLAMNNFLLSFVGRVDAKLNSVPGDSNSSFDWTFYVPRLRNYVVFYGELYADDDFVPFQNPPKNPFRSGIHLTRFPRLPRLDLHLEAASTESPGFRDNHGNLNYWNHKYRDGYTNNGNLIGHTVGRMGRSFQCWSNYWFSAQNALQFTYKHNTVSREFIPQGGAWQDYSLQSNTTFRSGIYLKSRVQYEHLSRYPLLFSGPRNNISVVLEVGFLSPKRH